MKKDIILLSLILFVLSLPFGGIYLLSQVAYNSTGCQQFNIDNIEVRTGIDIPAVTNKVGCHSDGRIKTTSFVIKEYVDLADYIQKNDFIKNKNSYENKGENATSKWTATLDLETSVLSVQILYKDVKPI